MDILSYNWDCNSNVPLKKVIQKAWNLFGLKYMFGFVSPPQFSTLYIVSFVVITVGFIMFNAVPTYTALPGSSSSEEDPAEDPADLVAESTSDRIECQLCDWHRKWRTILFLAYVWFLLLFFVSTVFFWFYGIHFVCLLLYFYINNVTFVYFLMTANPVSALILGSMW